MTGVQTCALPISAAAVVEESYTAQITARIVTTVDIALITFIEVSLRSSSTDLHIGESLEVTGVSTRLHAPPKDSASMPYALHALPCTDKLLHAPSTFFTRIHVPDLHQLSSALSDVITATSPTDIIDHIC